MESRAAQPDVIDQLSSRKDLKNKPLVEAILEVRWKLVTRGVGEETDPHYKLLLGRLFDRVQKEYPEHQQLPAANVPDEFVGHVVQHRFRVGEDKWPLVQVGPGIFTVNSTDDYTWSDFRPRTLDAIQKLYDAHPRVGEFEPVSLMLRYIDAVEFDYEHEDARSFLQDNLKLNVSLPSNLFAETGVSSRPNSLTCQSAFDCDRPKGIVNTRFATGQKGDRRAILWETTVHSAGPDLPGMPDQFEEWLDAAHDITDDWFFKLIEGDLERRFSGD